MGTRTLIQGLVAVALVLGTAGRADAETTGFYLGADAGQGSIDSDRSALDSSLVGAFNAAGLSVLDGSSSVSEDGLTWALTAGYRIFPYLAVEASYVDLGDFEYRARGTATDGTSTIAGAYRLEAHGSGVTASALAILPLDAWSLYARAGGLFAQIDYDQELTLDGQQASRSPSRSSNSFLWGVGVGYSNATWTTRLEYQQAQDVGDESIAGQADASRIVLGAIYHF